MLLQSLLCSFGGSCFCCAQMVHRFVLSRNIKGMFPWKVCCVFRY